MRRQAALGARRRSAAKISGEATPFSPGLSVIEGSPGRPPRQSLPDALSGVCVCVVVGLCLCGCTLEIMNGGTYLCCVCENLCECEWVSWWIGCMFSFVFADKNYVRYESDESGDEGRPPPSGTLCLQVWCACVCVFAL